MGLTGDSCEITFILITGFLVPRFEPPLLASWRYYRDLEATRRSCLM